jgi:CHAT domain-containing protein
MNKPQEAVGLAAGAVDIMRGQLDATADVQSERQQLAMNQTLRWYLDNYLSVTAEVKSPGQEAYPAVLAWKGAVTVRQQSIRRMRQARQGQLDPQTAELYQQLIEKTAALANLSRAVPKPTEAETYRGRLDQLHDDVEALQQKLAAISAPYRHELAQRGRTPNDVGRALPADTVLVDLLEYNHYAPPKKTGQKETWQRRLVAFVARADTPVERIELGPAEPIRQAITVWRLRNVDQPAAGSNEAKEAEADRIAWKRDYQDADPGNRLRDWIWDKLAPHIAGAKVVLLSPDGAAARFPWPALPGKQPGSYLIEDTAIAVVPIPSLLPKLLQQLSEAVPNEAATKGQPSLLLVGGVDFGADPGRVNPVALDRSAPRAGARYHWQPLPGTVAEVAGVKDVFAHRLGQAAPIELTGAAARKNAVREQMVKCRYLHFSTHGFFAPPEVKSALDASSTPNKSAFGELISRQDISGYHPDLLSGLVLAGANRPVEDGKEDGILTALEVSGLDLSHVDLATLSACETGLGKTAGGEGVLGLQRAFQSAGAKTVVASLWKVPDRATQALMIRFYDNLWNKKLTKLESLLEAQRWMLHEGPKQADQFRGEEFLAGPQDASLKSGRMPPRYWAAFVLSGDWR